MLPYVVLALVGLLVVWWIAMTYHKLVHMKSHVEDAFSTMDVYLKKRLDIIPHLISTIRSYVRHDSQKLQDVMNAREHAMTANRVRTRIANENLITMSMERLFILTERYPNLRVNSEFTKFKKKLEKIEVEIAGARENYNDIAWEFNNKIMDFPTSIIAKMFYFTEYNLFEVEGNDRRDNVEVDINDK